MSDPTYQLECLITWDDETMGVETVRLPPAIFAAALQVSAMIGMGVAPTMPPLNIALLLTAALIAEDVDSLDPENLKRYSAELLAWAVKVPKASTMSVRPFTATVRATVLANVRRGDAPIFGDP